jgi:preprotein translocase subunit YajC
LSVVGVPLWAGARQGRNSGEIHLATGKIIMTPIFMLLLQGGGGGLLLNIAPILLMIAVFYFLIIRPQQKRQADLQTTIASLKSGDRIVTSGGVIGTIKQVKPNSFILLSGDKAMLEVTRAAVAGRYNEKDEENKG